jgi:hypothetical protein
VRSIAVLYPMHAVLRDVSAVCLGGTSKLQVTRATSSGTAQPLHVSCIGPYSGPGSFGLVSAAHTEDRHGQTQSYSCIQEYGREGVNHFTVTRQYYPRSVMCVTFTGMQKWYVHTIPLS